MCVLVTSRFHGHVAEIELGPEEGLDHRSAANCDHVITLPRRVLVRRRGRLGRAKLQELDGALMVALGLGETAGRAGTSRVTCGQMPAT